MRRFANMGNRKERRRAALSTSGRRVKLDLNAEPSGELGGSSANENGVGDRDSKHSTGSPKPISSDQPTKNPLLLLGQYSDDEEDEESNDSPSVAAVNNSLKDLTDQVTESTKKTSDVVAAAGSIAQEYKTDKRGHTTHPDNAEVGSGNQKTATDSPNLIHQISAPDHYKAPETSDLQVIEGAISGWKTVRDESTNQCYYWNVETGETSWEVPQILSQTGEVTTAQKLQNSSEGVNLCYPSGTPNSGLVVDGYANTITGSGSSEPHSAYASSFITSNDAYYSYQQSDGNVEDWNILAASYGIVGKGADENVRVDDLSFRVLKFGEYLSERLQSLKGSSHDSNTQEWMSKYIAEVEIRLSDIKSLLSYGSALIPFWVHSERKLSQLGESFNYEASQLANANNEEVNCVSTLLAESEKCTETVKAEKRENLPSSDALNASVSTEFAEYINAHSSNACIDTEKIKTVEDALTGEGDVNDTDRPNEQSCVVSDSNRAPADHAEDDMDMDVDMEVEELMIPSHIAIVEPVTQDFTPQHIPPVSETIPHPPDEGWIPPPPPDEEMIPPPPPDEYFPPSPPDEPPAYTNPCTVYAGYTYGYYDQTVAGVHGAEFNRQVEGYQFATPQAGVYYEVPNSYITSAPVIANSVEPLLYYEPHGVQAQAPATSNAPSTELHTISGIANQNFVGETVLLCTEHVTNGDQSNEKRQLDASVVIPTIQAEATISTQTNGSSQGIDCASLEKATISKGKFKASRIKKRASGLGPSMSSNKKVSRLVDKWKAAKEELQEDEKDESEDSYEALEKKRQREIEEWRAKVIASGEAKDNANFQPLGGDWRERIKRRRAQLSAETSTDKKKNGKQEPDLINLAKDLPHGWQVHWDESSKQVYYSNIITSETTWTRPAQ